MNTTQDLIARLRDYKQPCDQQMLHEAADALEALNNATQPPHTPKVGDLRSEVVSPMAAWPFETEASVEARQRAAFEAKGV